MSSILFCLDYYLPHQGGAEVLFANLAEGLASSGHNVQILTQLVPGAPSAEVRNGVKIRRINCFGSRYLFTIFCLPFLWSLAGKADLLHATTFASAIPSWFISRLRRKPMTLTVHEVWVGKWNQVSDSSKFMNWIHDKIERLIYFFDYRNYIAVSKSTAADLKNIGVAEDKITVIYNGVNYDYWNTDGRSPNKVRLTLGLGDDFLFFFSGRPGRSKGLSVLLEAMAVLVKDFPRVRLLALVSDSRTVIKERNSAKKLIRKLGLVNNVIFHAPVRFSELADYVYCADTVVVPSLSEGFGFAAAEACALERPVIVTDNASMPEVVSGKCLLVPPRNPQALADAMKKALRGEFQIKEQRRFLLSDNIRNHMDYYRKLMNHDVN